MPDPDRIMPRWSFDLLGVMGGGREQAGGYQAHVGYCAALGERVCLPFGAGFGTRLGSAPVENGMGPQETSGTFEMENNLRAGVGLQFLLAAPSREVLERWPSVSLGFKAIGGFEWISGHYNHAQVSGSSAQEKYESLGLSYGGQIYALARGSEAWGIFAGFDFLSLPGAGREPDRSFGADAEMGIRFLYH